MNARERYFWDLTGYLVVRNVLTPDEIAAANKTVEECADRIQMGEDNVLAGQSERLKGTGRPMLTGMLEFEKPYCEPFRNMLVHPVLVQRLNVMCGKGFRLDHGPWVITTPKGGSGHRMHGSGEPHRPHVAYHHQNGATYCGGVTVAWQLTDCPKGMGGFACVPGSHKSRFSMPGGVRSGDTDMDLIVQPELNAGDLLFFMDSAQSHGALPWKNDIPRRSVLFKFAGRTAIRSGREFAPPEIYWGEELVEGMTEEQRAVMYGPYSNHRGEVPFLTVEEDGTVNVE